MIRLLAFVCLLIAPGVLPAQRSTLTIETGGHHSRITQVLFTKDNKQLITVSLDRTVRIWQANTGQAVNILRLPVLPGDYGQLFAGALSGDGKRLAVAGFGYRAKTDSPFESPIYVIDLTTGQVEKTLKEHAAFIDSLSFSATGNILASADPTGTILIWDAESGKRLSRIAGPKGGRQAIALSPDGSQVVGVGQDIIGRIWTVNGSKPVVEFKVNAERSPALAVAWSPDGKWIATGLDQKGVPGTAAQTFAIWTSAGKLHRQVTPVGDGKPMQTRSLAFTPDSKSIVQSNTEGSYSNAAIWDVLTGKLVKSLFSGNREEKELPDGPVAVSGDGKYIAIAADRNHRVSLFTSNGVLRRKIGGDGQQITEVGWIRHPDPTKFEIAWRNSLPPAGFDPWKPLPEGIFENSFNFNSLTVSSEPKGPFRNRFRTMKPLHIWSSGADLIVEKDGKELWKIQPAKDRARSENRGGAENIPISSVSMVTADRAVAAQGGLLHLFDLSSGKPIHRYFGNAGTIRSVAPSPRTAKFLVGGGDDQILHIWDAENSHTFLSLFVHEKDWIAWTVEGYYAASPGGERLMGWTVNNGLDKLASFHTAERFRKQLYRPDIVSQVLVKGTITEAVASANAAIGKKEMAPPKIEEMLPPKAEIKVVMAGDKATIEVTAASTVSSQPVTGLRLLLDGRGLTEDGYRLELKPTAKAEQKWTLTLPPGKHEVKVLARGPDAAALSNAVTVDIPLPQAQKPVMHLLTVGVNKYQQPALKLECAANDASEILTAFQTHCAGQGNRFREVQGKALLDEKATRAGVLGELKEIRKRAKPEDTAIFFFAGHGLRDGADFYLLSVEADPTKLPTTAISGKELREALAGMPCPVLMILDACHSAAAIKDLQPATDDLTRSVTDDEVAVTVLAAAMAYETAGELRGNGRLTSAIKKGLAISEGMAFDPNDRLMYIHHLFGFVFSDVRKESKGKQNPFLQMPWTAPPLAIRAVP